MLKNIAKIKLSGAIFDSATLFDFFSTHEKNKVKTVKGTLIYGRNGSGKSTIAKAFRKLAGEDLSTITNVAVYDDRDQVLTFTEEEKKRIFVFDEDYVDKNVKLQQDHLDTIVMLGPAADLADKIEKALSACNAAKDAYTQQDVKIKEYCDSKSVKSPKYHLSCLKEALKGDDNWAGRDKEINNTRQNTGVNEETYKKFVPIKPSKLKTDLISEYKTKIEELKAVRTGTVTTINKKVPTISSLYQTLNVEAVRQLLAERIEKPELSEREKKLFVLLQAGKGSDLSQRLVYLKNEETVECPYCFQTITAEYKESLVKSIEKVLSKIVKEHQQKLRVNILECVDLNLDLYEKLNGYQKCIELIEKINTVIKEYNDNLKKKTDNPYEPIIVEKIIVQNIAKQLSDALVDLEKARVKYNANVQKTQPLIDELKRINDEIAHWDVAPLAVQYNKQQAEYIKEKISMSS